MKRGLYGVSAFLVVVLLILSNTDGYLDYPTTVINSEQANDTYLDSLLKAAGYEGKKVYVPNPNLFESTRLKKTLDQHGYASPRSSETYLWRSLADGQQCWSGSDCLSKSCVNNTCTPVEQPSFAWSPPSPTQVVESKTKNSIVSPGIVIMALLAVIMIMYALRK